MTRSLPLLLASAVLGTTQIIADEQPRPAILAEVIVPPALPDSGLPVGKWVVLFSNGVKEVCVIRKDGSACVVEPLRASAGKATLQGRSVVIAFEDDRLERWTWAGKRLVVEHWFPASEMPAGTSVLGIAERRN